jgi:hypothetical protein
MLTDIDFIQHIYVLLGIILHSERWAPRSFGQVLDLLGYHCSFDFGSDIGMEIVVVVCGLIGKKSVKRSIRWVKTPRMLR